MSLVKGTLVCLSFILTFLCDSVPGNKTPPTCCLPPTFRTRLGPEGGMNPDNTDQYSYYSELYYDFPNKRWGTIDGKADTYDTKFNGRYTVEDYKKHKIVRAGKYCRIEKIDERWDMKRYCLPEDAELLQTVTMGYGDEALTYDEWKWTTTVKNASGSAMLLDVTTAITGDCEFLYEIGFWYDWEFNNVAYMSFFDLQEKIDSGKNVFKDVYRFSTKCRKGEVPRDMFDQYRATSQRFLAYRIRDLPPDAPEPSQDDTHESDQ